MIKKNKKDLRKTTYVILSLSSILLSSELPAMERDNEKSISKNIIRPMMDDAEDFVDGVKSFWKDTKKEIHRDFIRPLNNEIENENYISKNIIQPIEDVIEDFVDGVKSFWKDAKKEIHRHLLRPLNDKKQDIKNEIKKRYS
jgi:preprotein translocase subunit SecE